LFLVTRFTALCPTTRWLKANKNGFTLGFAGSHTGHLAFILTLMAAVGRDNVLKSVMVIAFTTGYLFIYGLAVGPLYHHPPALFSYFEALAHYYLMTLFAVSFTGHAMTKPLFYTPFALVAVAAIGLRIAAAFQARKEQTLSASA